MTLEETDLSEANANAAVIKLRKPSEKNGAIRSDYSLEGLKGITLVRSRIELLVAVLGSKSNQSLSSSSVFNDVKPDMNYACHVPALSSGAVYIAASFQYDQLPTIFTLGDGRAYGGHFNGPLNSQTSYGYALRFITQFKDSCGSYQVRIVITFVQCNCACVCRFCQL